MHFEVTAGRSHAFPVPLPSATAARIGSTRKAVVVATTDADGAVRRTLKLTVMS